MDLDRAGNDPGALEQSGVSPNNNDYSTLTHQIQCLAALVALDF